MSGLRLFGFALRLLVVAGSAVVLTTCTAPPGLMGQVQTLGALRVATVNSVSTYYLDADGPTGFEYDLAGAFANSLGVDLDVMVLPDRRAVLAAVADGRADIGIGVATSEARRRRVRFTPVYSRTPLEVVYRVEADKPATLGDLSGRLALPADAAVGDWLARTHPAIDITLAREASDEDLIDRVAAGALDTTIANADLVAINQRYYPNLRVAFELKSARQKMAWAFAQRRPGDADLLYNKAIAFLEASKAGPRLHILRDRYFGHVERLGFVGGHEFARQVDARLDRWRGYFKRAAAKYELDWRLLAAIGYQESHWDKNAVSPTAVRGIMMLTRAAAEELDVRNRRNPQQSIDGGARYFLRMKKRLPAAIEPPDRTWFALAAYNVGYGHVMDARRLLAARGRDPNRWVNLRDALPWLTEQRYLSGTKYGYARGREAATYVGNIRAYYDILVWMHGDRIANAKPPPGALDDPERTGPARSAPVDTISLRSPAF